MKLPKRRANLSDRQLGCRAFRQLILLARSVTFPAVFRRHSKDPSSGLCRCCAARPLCSVRQLLIPFDCPVSWKSGRNPAGNPPRADCSESARCSSPRCAEQKQAALCLFGGLTDARHAKPQQVAADFGGEVGRHCMECCCWLRSGSMFTQEGFAAPKPCRKRDKCEGKPLA